MYKRLLLIAGFVVLVAHPVFAAIPEGTGFIQKNIWYSHYPLVAGDTVKIFTLINNPSAGVLSGTAEFHDKGTLMGSKPFSVSAHSYEAISLDWKVIPGDHAISAEIKNAKLLEDSKSTTVTVPNVSTGEDQTFVAAPPPPPVKQEAAKPASATSSTDTTIVEINKVQKFLNEKTPVGGLVAGVDTFRSASADTFENNAKEARAEIDVNTSHPQNLDPDTVEVPDTVKGGYVSKDTNAALKKPFAYIKLFFFNTLHFIFDNPFVFYGLLLVVLFLICRAIFRAWR